VRQLIDRAVRIASTRRCVTCVILPTDLQLLDYKDPPVVHGATHTGTGHAGPAQLPNADLLHQAATVLNAGKKVAILVGAGALGATDEVITVANRLQAGVAKALLGKAALPDDLPWVTGSLGLLGTKPSWDLMKGCDTFLMIGSAFPYSEFLPDPGDARGVQIDINGTLLSLRYPMEVSMVGDSAVTLRALLPMLEQKSADHWRRGIETGVAAWWKTLEERAMASANPINPQRVVLGAVQAVAGELHHDGGFRLGRQLVCARHQDAAGHDGVAVGGWPRWVRRRPMRWRPRWRSRTVSSSPLSAMARCR